MLTSMQQPPPVPDLLSALATFSRTLNDVLTKPDVDWDRHPDSESWNLTQVVCHLRDVEHEVHQVRFHRLIDSENAFLPGVSADSWAETRHYHQQDGPAALAAFVAARQETIDLLTDLEDGLWQRQGRHAFFGFTSMHELLNLMVRHDEAHWEQIKELLTESA